MGLFNYVSIILLFVVTSVYGKHCTHIYETGYMKYFFCNTYEYCCGPMCCRSQAVTFYQVWYFWLIVFLTLMLCSGGSWWYRFHHREPFVIPATTVPTANMVPGGRPVIAPPPGFIYGTTAGPQPFYPQQAPLHHLPPMQQNVNTSMAPPPYYEPPPSYAAATTRRNN